MPPGAALHELEDGRYALSGDLVFGEVTRLLAEGDAAFGALAEADIDLARVTRVDSAGLALLLEWSAVARDAGRRVRYRNLPASLESLAGISEVSGLLGVADSADG